MRLELARHPISELRWGDFTRLDGTTLEIDQDELRGIIMGDQRIESVDLQLVRPGENCRAGPVLDIIEPRAKEPDASPDFPGVLSGPAIAGSGTAHVLEGAAVTVLNGASSTGPIRGILEMSGPASEHSPYATLQHLVMAPHARPELAGHIALNATQTAGLKAAVYLAQASFGHTPAVTESFGPVGPNEPGREGLPRVIYIGQIFSRQQTAEIDEQVLYGLNTDGMLPTLLHPNEWLDGAVVASYWTAVGGAETYFYQNHPIITELYRRHDAGELNFVGTVATISGSDNEDRDRGTQIAAHLAKWSLNADAAVLTKYGGGVPHADMAETARLLENMGVRTSVMVSDMSRDRRVESALLFNFPEVDAIVYCGGNDTRWEVPPVERVIAGNPHAAEALSGLCCKPLGSRIKSVEVSRKPGAFL
jgi:glycine reductase